MKLRKAGTFLLELVEMYIPLAAFCMLFFTFIWATFTRYVLRQPCGWAIDVELGCYLWTILFSASYVMRKNKHVRFTIVYDMMGPRAQLVMRLISNLLIILPFTCLIMPTWRYLAGLRTVTTALQLPLKFYYMPILWFIVSTVLYALRDLCADLRLLRRQPRGEAKEEGTP